jgi:hypothetical protein
VRFLLVSMPVLRDNWGVRDFNHPQPGEEPMSRDPLEVLTEALEHHAGTPLGEELLHVREHYSNLRTVAALAVSAAVKHTGGRHAVRDAHFETSRFLKLDKEAVGRLHNAAKVARRSLDAGACGMCKIRADKGIDMIGRLGDCDECGRIWNHEAKS